MAHSEPSLATFTRTHRELLVITHPQGLRDAALWKGLAAICMVLRRRVVEGVEEVEFHYYIGSFVGTAQE